MKAALFRTLLSAFLLIGFVPTHAGLAQTGSAASVPAVAVVADLSDSQLENLYTQELDRQAEAFIQKFKTQVSPGEQQVTETALRRAMTVFKLQWKKFHGFQQQFAKMGRKAILLPALTEIITTFALAPALVALGHPQLAAATMIIPFEPLVLGGLATYELNKERVKLSWRLRNELHDADVGLGDLDSFRREVLGFEMKNRIQSTVFENVDSEISKFPVELVKKIKDRGRVAGAISTAELVDIVKGHGDEGARVLKELYLDQAHPDLYAAKLLAYVQSDPELAAQAVEKAKLGIALNADQIAIRNHLLEIDNAGKELAYLQTDLAAKRKALKDLIKRGADKGTIRQFRSGIDILAHDLNDRTLTFKQLQYAFLADVKTPGSDLASAIEKSRQNLQQARSSLGELQKSYQQGLQIFNVFKGTATGEPNGIKDRCWRMLQAVGKVLQGA